MAECPEPYRGCGRSARRWQRRQFPVVPRGASPHPRAAVSAFPMSPSPSEKEHALQAEIARLRALLRAAGIDVGQAPPGIEKTPEPSHETGEQLRLAQEAGGVGGFSLDIASNL